MFAGLATALLSKGDVNANQDATAPPTCSNRSSVRIYLAVPIGGEFPLNYRPDGQLDGSGEALGLERLAKNLRHRPLVD